jgi:glycosyltransferase involved in cell wall biosynthesis
LTEHTLPEGSFVTGSWEKARNENETHLNGTVLLSRNDFLKVNGYSEYISTYGWDDSDLYIRLENLGLKRVFFNFDTLHHIEHPARMQHQERSSVFMDISDEEWSRLNILTNRHLCRKTALWSLKNEMAPYKIIDSDTDKYIVETTQLDRNKIPLHIREEAFQVAIRERLLELIPDFEPEVFVELNNESLREIYRSFLKGSDNDSNNLFEVFKQANALLLKNRHERGDLLKEKQQQQNDIEVKSNTIKSLEEKVEGLIRELQHSHENKLALQEKLNDVGKELYASEKLIENNNDEIERLFLLIDKNNNEIERLNLELGAFKYNLSQKEESIRNKEAIIANTQKYSTDIATKYAELEYKFELQNKTIEKLNQQISLKEIIIAAKQNEADMIRRSITYRLVRLMLLPLLIFKPTYLLTKLHSIRREKKHTRLIKNSDFFDKQYYLTHNPDVAKSGINPAKHYLLHGGFEGRKPSEAFDSKFYLKQNTDVKDYGMNPLLHYILYGEKEGRKPLSCENNAFVEIENTNNTDAQTTEEQTNVEAPKPDKATEEIRLIKESGLFDEEYYFKNYPDVKEAEVDAITHYHYTGWVERRNPSPKFDTSFYLDSYPDVTQAGIDPLFHYVVCGKSEGRVAKPIVQVLDYENVNETKQILPIDVDKLKTKLIAFYLPQFHPIPENDEWWGKGFTEWHNVAKAKPQFPGHYQPHIPADLGFYDLRLPEVLEQQISMAREFGIYGFCIYYYWFDGKRLLDKPLEMLYNHPEWDMNYCVCWANENWTRRWDGMENEILIGQNHSDKDDLDFIKDVSKYFKDNRYIKVEDKPLLIIYRPGLFPNIKETANEWRRYCIENLGTDIFLGMVQGFGSSNPEEYGFDAAIEFPPHNFNLQFINDRFDTENFNGHIIDASKLVSDSKGKIQNADYDLIRGVMLAWDNTARRDKKSHIYLNNTPCVYENWLNEAITDTLYKKNNRTPFVFINAWNEWAEGCHLEPDKKYGYAYLNATQRALLNAENKHNNKLSNAEIVFISHDACLAGAQLVLLDVIKWFAQSTFYKLKLITLGGGGLLEQFSKYAETTVIEDLDRNSVKIKLGEMISDETSLIYLNSFASGRIIKELKTFNIPIITHVHELERSIKIYANEFYKDVLRFSDHFIACSGAVYSNLLNKHRVSVDKIDLVHAFVENRVDERITENEKRNLKQKLNLPNTKIIAGAGLGVFWRKGVDLFIDVCNELTNIGSEDFTFLWIGDCTSDGNIDEFGQWSDQLKRIEKLGLQNKIIFTGTVSNVRDYLLSSDLFLLPSREDPFPLVCLEAADCFLPVICFEKAGGMPEFVLDDAGFVVPFENSKRMAEKTHHLLLNKVERFQRGENAHRRFVDNYSVDALMGRILDTVRRAGNIKPLVSVVVPNYNYYRYLPKRLDTIYNQSFKDFEVIILDDCSSDNSLEIINNYKSQTVNNYTYK